MKTETNEPIQINRFCGYIAKKGGKIVTSIARDNKTGEVQAFHYPKGKEI